MASRLLVEVQGLELEWHALVAEFIVYDAVNILGVSTQQV